MNEQLLAQLERLVKLMEQGAINQQEFEYQKALLMKGNDKNKVVIKNWGSEPKPQRDNSQLGFYLILGFGLIFLLVMLFPGKDSDNANSSAKPKTRTEIVNGFFSGWDGSHPDLERQIKASMNDPDSYEHVETKFRDDGATVYVFTKFRGKNGFGGTIVNYAEGTLNGTSGDLVDWKFIKE